MAQSLKIIQNAIVITCEDPNRVLRADLFVRDDRIAEISNRGEILKSMYPSAEVIDASGKIIMPGFVDAHYHGESFLLKHFTQLAPSSRWTKDGSIRRVLNFIRSEATKEDLVTAYRSAYFSALKSGVTTVAEFGFDSLEAPYQAATESMRRADLRGSISLHNGDQIERALSTTLSNVRHTVVLPSEDDLTTYNLNSTLRAARDHTWPIVVHYGETTNSDDVIKRNFSKSLMNVLVEYKVFDNPVQLVHLCDLEERDVKLMAQLGIPLVLTPASVVSQATESPQLGLLLEQGVSLALGSDWGSADPFANMRALRSVAMSQQVPELDAAFLLNMHTQGSARALGLQEEIGMLSPGRKADLVFVDAGDVRLSSLLHANDPDRFLEEFVSHASSRDVSDVMINGEFFVRQGQIMTYAEEDLKRELASLLSKLNTLEPVKEKLHGVADSPRKTVTKESSVPLSQEVLHHVEEGFRIIRRNESADVGAEKIIPMNPSEGQKVELSKSVKRVFGEEDE